MCATRCVYSFLFIISHHHHRRRQQQQLRPNWLCIVLYAHLLTNFVSFFLSFFWSFRSPNTLFLVIRVAFSLYLLSMCVFLLSSPSIIVIIIIMTEVKCMRVFIWLRTFGAFIWLCNVQCFFFHLPMIASELCNRHETWLWLKSNCLLLFFGLPFYD